MCLRTWEKGGFMMMRGNSTFPLTGLSQLSLTGRFLPFWENLSGIVNFFNSEEHRNQIVLFADAPLTGKVEALLEPQHGFKSGD